MVFGGDGYCVMAGKITTILARNEAEVYRAQGLHKEALEIYCNLLATSPHIDPALKSAIEDQIDKLNGELCSNAADESHRLTAADIIRVKQGWGTKATEGDMLVCAQAFFQIGHYRDALMESARLLQKGLFARDIIALFANCLVHLQSSGKISRSIDRLSTRIFKRGEAQIRFLILLTEALIDLNRPLHADALYRHLQKKQGLNKDIAERLRSIAKAIHGLRDVQSHSSRKTRQGGQSPSSTPMLQKPEGSRAKASRAQP